MNDNFENKVSYEIRKRIAISNFEKEQIYSKNQYTHLKNKNWRYNRMKKRAIATVCTGIILVSGVVLGANIENIKKFFGGGLDKGTQTATENGYIANPEMDYINSDTKADSLGTVLDNVPTEVKIENFMMDDLNLNLEFDFKFDEQIKNIFDLDDLHNIELNDLIIKDEENRILYAGNDKQAFEKYCNANHLNYTFGETNENYLNCGLQWYPFSHNKNDNTVKLTYNIYTDTFPNSKKLYFSFEKIKLLSEASENIVTLKGIWNIELDVPENMYNRTTESYKVVKCDNENFEVYASKVSDTGFELGLTISNIKKPETLTNEEMDEISEYIKSQSSYSYTINAKNEPEVYKKYMEIRDKLHPIAISEYSLPDGKKVLGSYIENSNGEKFVSTLSPSRRQNQNFIDGNKFDFYETFSMTKYDTTDKIKAVLYYYGEPVTIELEKVK